MTDRISENQIKTKIDGFGCVTNGTAMCIAADGRDVIGIYCNPTEGDPINAGQSTMIDWDVGEIVRNSVAETITEGAVSAICLGPPRQFPKIRFWTRR